MAITCMAILGRKKDLGIKRRVLVSGAGLAGVAGAGALMYRSAPTFWKQYFDERSRPILPANVRPNVSEWSDDGLYAAWLGHSTVLLKLDGFTIITDPVFGERAGLSIGPLTLGIKRIVEPALSLAGLPHIDLILSSHAHMDHLDVPSLRSLENRRTQIVMASSTSDLIRPGRYGKVTELGWGEKAQAGPATIRALEVNHWGARMRTDTYRGYNGYVVEVGRWRVLFAGDTAMTSLFQEARSSRQIDLAIMPIGAYNPWIHYHCNPEQAWRMGNDARGEFFLPVHHQTFRLSREPYYEPIERFVNAAGSNPNRVVVREIGQEFHLA
jgi:L-ascorbate metabolism protein UlaG (beta-lactamase superfamily)